jgi:hypothetical protein
MEVVTCERRELLGQSRYTGNNGHTIYMTKITKTKETTKNGQSRYTGNNGHTIHMTKKTKNTDEQFEPFGELMKICIELPCFVCVSLNM